MGEAEQEHERSRRPSLGQRMASFVLGTTEDLNTNTPPASPVKRRPSLGRLIRRPSLGNSADKARRRNSLSNNDANGEAVSPPKRRQSLGKGVSMIMNTLGVGSRHQSTRPFSSDDETADMNASFNELEDTGSSDTLGMGTSSRTNSTSNSSSPFSSASQSVLQSIQEHEQRLQLCLDRIQEQIESNLAMATARLDNGGEDNFAAHSGAILSMRKAHKNRLVHASTTAACTKLQILRDNIQAGKAGTKAEQKVTLRDIFGTLKQESANAVVPADNVLLEELRQMVANEK